MAQRQLSLSARPQTLDALIGQGMVASAIRGHYKSGRMPTAWLFYGPKGTGKTSIARILALSLQCSHQEQEIDGLFLPFGHPCKECRLNRHKFSTYEIPAAKIDGKDDLRELLKGADYGVLGEGKYRVYIIDELHSASKAAQKLLLSYFEDSPETTVFICCSSRPQDIDEPLRSRCVSYQMTELEVDDIEILVRRLLKKVKSKLPADRLYMELIVRQVRSPRLIAQAVEKYVAGNTVKEAASVEGTTGNIDMESLTRGVVKGDWGTVSDTLTKAERVDIRPLRLGLIAYLRGALLNDKEVGTRAKVITDAIVELAHVQNSEDTVIAGVLAAVLYRVTAKFSQYKL